jgi:hypothetical protein
MLPTLPTKWGFAGNAAVGENLKSGLKGLIFPTGFLF